MTPAASGVDNAGSVAPTGTVGMGSGPASVSANAAAATGSVRRNGGLIGLVVAGVALAL